MVFGLGLQEMGGAPHSSELTWCTHFMDPLFTGRRGGGASQPLEQLPGAAGSALTGLPAHSLLELQEPWQRTQFSVNNRVVWAFYPRRRLQRVSQTKPPQGSGHNFTRMSVKNDSCLVCHPFPQITRLSSATNIPVSRFNEL